ncbi:MAG: ATP-binding protein [Bacillota bacterium]
MIKVKSLKIKIPVLIIFLVIFTILGSSYMSYKIFTEDIKEQIINKNAVITDMISDQVGQHLTAAQDTVEFVAKYAVNNSFENIKLRIDRVYSSYKWMDLMFFMTVDGRIIYSNPHNDVIYTRNYREREYYQIIRESRQPYISKVFISSILNQPHIIIVAPIIDEETGEFQGIIGGGVPLYSLKKIVNKTQASFDGRIYVLDVDGTVLVSPDDQKIKEGSVLEKEIFVEGNKVDLKKIMEEYDYGQGAYKENFENIYVSFCKIPNYRGMVVVEQNEQYIIGQIGQSQSKFISAITFVMIAVLILSIYFAYTITQPIEKLLRFVRGISHDIESSDEEVEISAQDEIGELEQAFNNMSKELRKKMEDLRSLHKREYDIKKYLNSILKSAASGIIVIDCENKISIFNTAAEEITGYRSQYFINKDVHDLTDKTELPKDIFNDYIDGEGQFITEKECNLKKSDHTVIPLSISLSPVYNDDGQVISTVCMLRDLTKIKTLEEQLRLEDRLKTIGQLSSSIIHEIGNPLAGMSNLLEVIKDHIEDVELREELLDALRDEVNMLNKLVINFLDFTRGHKIEADVVNIITVINSALNILNSEIGYKNIRVKKIYADKFPLVRVDAASIRQAFINILKNSIQALDYNGELEIEVKKVEENKTGKICISIRDNGIGISKERIDRIFDPFFTTKQDGTGLGLSIVHKIVSDNHGTVSVRSELGKFTEFILCFKEEIKNEADDY